MVGRRAVRAGQGVREVHLFFFSSRRRHTRSLCDWSSDVCSSDLAYPSALRAIEDKRLSRRRGDAADGVIWLEEVDETALGKIGHEQIGDVLKRRLVVQRCDQQLARRRQKGNSPLRGLGLDARGLLASELEPFGFGRPPQDRCAERPRGGSEYLDRARGPIALLEAVVKAHETPPGWAGEDRHDDDRTHPVRGELGLLVWRKSAQPALDDAAIAQERIPARQTQCGQVRFASRRRATPRHTFGAPLVLLATLAQFAWLCRNDVDPAHPGRRAESA